MMLRLWFQLRVCGKCMSDQCNIISSRRNIALKEYRVHIASIHIHNIEGDTTYPSLELIGQIYTILKGTQT